MTRLRLRRLAAGAFALWAVTACSPAVSVEIDDAWTPEPARPGAAAVYFTITADGDDALLGAHTDAAAATELHGTAGENGAVMREVDEVPLPASEPVTFEPGGLHVMLLNPDELSEGDRFDLVLEFARAGEVTVEVEVVEPWMRRGDARRAPPPSSPDRSPRPSRAAVAGRRGSPWRS